MASKNECNHADDYAGERIVNHADNHAHETFYEPYWEAARAASSDDPAHDILHVTRVFRLASYLCEEEGASQQIVLTAVLLHELFSYPKGHPLSPQSGDVCADRAEVVLRQHNFPVEDIPAVLTCIREHSFSRGITPVTLEGKIVQDADRLDAIGAIGIARCFATCAEMGRPFYHPDDPFCTNREPNDKAWGIDHFYTKLLRLKATMHTETARRLAADRTVVMRSFLDQLQQEIETKPVPR